MPFKKGHTMNRRGRPRTSQVARTPTPANRQDAESDDELAGADVDETRDVTPQEFEDAATPAQDSAADEEEESSPNIVQPIPRRRGRGGRRGGMRSHLDTPEPGDDDASENGTPQRRKRGRPGGWRGGRGRKSNIGPSHVTRVPIDKEGNTLPVVDDELQVPEDPEGETKVNKSGHLLGDREYRVRTFTISGRDDRLYMLSTEPARCTGFRDSYLFFTKHPKLFKIIVGEEEKKDLIARDIIPNSYKGRAIGVVTAHSVFREFGAKIVVGGRKVIDDYYVEQARANGDVEGELVDPNDRIPAPGEDYNRNQYVAWFGASNVYHNQSQGGPVPGGGKPGLIGKRRNNVTVGNWQFLHAREASRFNSTITAMRQANLEGVYDTHTNLMFYPKIMQPTHAKWERVEPPPDADSKPFTNGYGSDSMHLTNGHAYGSDHDSAMEVEEVLRQEGPKSTIFSDVPPVISRNFAVIDTTLSTAPISSAGLPGNDGSIADLNSTSLSNISPDLVDELPDECKAAFHEARAIELGWKKQWTTERHDGLRGDLFIGYNGYPV